MLYLDSSAVVKLVAREAETPALVAAIRVDPETVSSALAWTEVVRAARRARVRVGRAEAVLERIALAPVDEGILRAAAGLGPPGLRTLDAIHLATALSLREDLTGLVTYDARLAETAAGEGLTVLAPGT